MSELLLFLKGRLDAEIISVYEKMAELKIGNIYQKKGFQCIIHVRTGKTESLNMI